MEITTGPQVEIELAGALVTIPSATIAELWLEKLRGGEGVTAAAPPIPPRIGGDWYGGIYAGIARGEGDVPDHHLIVLDEAPERLKWHDAVNWARDRGQDLPTRRELALCYANAPEIFQSAWYWSSTQYAGTEDFAWCQYFDDGLQDDNHKSGEYRARAVRRLPLE